LDKNVFSPKKKSSGLMDYLLPPEQPAKTEIKPVSTANLKPLKSAALPSTWAEGGGKEKSEEPKIPSLLRHRSVGPVKDSLKPTIELTSQPLRERKQLSTAERLHTAVQSLIENAKQSKWLFGGDVGIGVLTQDTFKDIQRTIWAVQGLFSSWFRNGWPLLT
jgi:hypothetical protein